MPWTVADVDKHKRGLSPAQKRRWVEIANSALRKCQSEGGSNCDAVAIRQANGVAGHMMTMIEVNSEYEVRTEEKDGVKYLVVPVVMMVEGVHNGSRGPLLHLVEDLGQNPQLWNGRPVVVNHPEDEDGNYISANSPNVVSVGVIYNSHMDGDKLKAEAWLEEDKLEGVSEETLTRVRDRAPLEVSVGAFTDEERITGTWHEEQYEAIARNHRPDHLALLPNAVGACSITDGCGVRVNKEGGNMNEALVINALSYSGTESTAWSAPTLSAFGHSSWDGLSTAQKAQVASHYLIGSSSAGSFGDLKLPVVNPRTHKLNERALRAVIGGRGAAVGGVSAEVRSAARRRAYRLLNSAFNAGLTIPEGLEEAKLLNIEGFAVNMIGNADSGYKELVDGIRVKLDRMDNQNTVHFLEEVYDSDFVYRVQNSEGTTYYRHTYSANDGDIEFTGAPVEVRRKVEFINMIDNNDVHKRTKFNSNKEDVDMKDDKKNDTPCCEDLVNELIANERTKWEESDKEWLMTLEENQLAKFVPNEEKPKEEPEKEEPKVQADKGKKKEEEEKPLTIDEYIDKMPVEMRDQTRSGLRLFDQQKSSMIKTILDNTKKGVWSQDILETMEMDTLERIHDSVKEEVDYSGQGGGGGISTNKRKPLHLPTMSVKEDKKEE